MLPDELKSEADLASERRETDLSGLVSDADLGGWSDGESADIVKEQHAPMVLQAGESAET